MIHFQGDRTFPIPVSGVFASLGDASFLLGCLKDVEEVVESTPDVAKWKFRPHFSFISGSLNITMSVVERAPETAIRVNLLSRGIGATASVQTLLTFLPNDSGTAVHWTADVTELTGLLKLVPKGLISSTAGKVIDETWEEIAKKLG